MGRTAPGQRINTIQIVIDQDKGRRFTALSRGAPTDEPTIGVESVVVKPDQRPGPLPADDGTRASLASIRTKVRTLVSIAASNDSSIPSAEVLLLLPRGAFTSPAGLEEFVSHDRTLRTEIVVSDGELAFKGSEALARDRSEQTNRTAYRVRLARSFAHRLVRACPWIRLVAISGSTAYGRTKHRDDIDFFVVTRKNRLWVTLLFALILAKIQRTRNPSAPVFCFNRLLDEAQCDDTFRTHQEPLLAREALTMRVLEGRTYFLGLIQSASWMGGLFPGLYQESLAQGEGELAVTNRDHRFWSFANWIAFGAVAPYAALANLSRNHRLLKSGEADARFRTVIGRGFFAYESRKFDLLKDAYRRAF